jgi:UDP-4-amino-4,6-dideoxy-N-acetyl-beta-L-altrosamine N-acetyltransferase
MYRLNDYCLRTIERKDLEWVRIMHNSPDVLCMLTDTSFVTEKQQTLWFEKLSAGNTSKRLVLEYNNKNIGLARLDDIDNSNKSICIGLDILKEYRGQGNGFMGFKTLLEYCFKELNMNRTWLLVIENNKPAINLYNKLGYVVEGRQRQRLYRDRKYLDYIMMSLLREEYNDQNV